MASVSKELNLEDLQDLNINLDQMVQNFKIARSN